jgi:hypothetical protein
MKRYLFVAFAAIGWSASLRADTAPIFSDLPSTYVPGTSFTFNVSAPDLTDLGAYNVELVFQTTVNPTNLLTITAAPPTNLNLYPFGTLDNYLQGGPFVSGNSIHLTLSDFTLSDPGVTTVAGVNDLLAQVTVMPGAGLTGPISISVAPDSLQFDTLDGDPIPSNPPGAAFVSQSGGATPVPTPPALFLMGSVLWGLSSKNSVARHPGQAQMLLRRESVASQWALGSAPVRLDLR